MNAAQTASNVDGARHRGPSLLGVAIVFTSLFVGSLVATAAMTGGGHFPSPFDAASLATSFFSEHGRAVRLAAFLQFGAAIPLAIFTAVSASRLRFLGVSAAGPTIGLLGGILASSMAAFSGLVQWILAEPEVATSEGVMRGFHWLAFATGGPGFVVPFGILVAGVSVSGGLTGNLPRWVMWLGLMVAALAELSSLTIATRAAIYLLPAARFPGLVWLIAVGATLPTRRRRERRSAGAPIATFEEAPQS